MERQKPIIGQEAICPDGLGRVSDFNFNSSNEWIEVSTYYRNRLCHWSPDNITLIKLELGTNYGNE